MLFVLLLMLMLQWLLQLEHLHKPEGYQHVPVVHLRVLLLLLLRWPRMLQLQLELGFEGLQPPMPCRLIHWVQKEALVLLVVVH
jgi:hypothetical protein